MKLIALVIVILFIGIAVAPAFAQMPPTPTPLPAGPPKFTLPTQFSLWGGAPTAIQVWNWIGPAQPVVQGLAIIGLVIAGMFLVMKFMRQMTRKDSEQ